MKNILHFALLFVLMACGTIKRSSSIIVVDSTPRGVKLYDGDLLIGETPFFWEILPHFKKKYQSVYGDLKFDTSYKCSFNWSQSIIPDLIPLFISNGYYITVTFLLTDWASGGIYQCSKPFKINPPVSAPSVPATTRSNTIVILPPEHVDEKVSDLVVTTWTEKRYQPLPNKAQAIWTIANYQTSKSLFYPLGISNLSSNRPNEIKDSHLKEVLYNLKATHVIYFEIDHQTGEVKPILYDAFTLQPIEAKSSGLFAPIEITEVKNSQSIVARGITLLPNAFDLSFPASCSTTYETHNEVTELSVSKHPDELPSVLTSLGLNSVLHPQFYSPWDYAFTISPGLAGKSWKSDMINIRGEKYSILGESYSLAGYFNLTFFSPFGQLGFGVGPHLGYLSLDDNRGQSKSGFAWGSSVFVNSSWFLSQRYFLFVQIKIFQYGGYEKIDGYPLEGWVSSTLGIGYYFPEIRTHLRNKFN